ncbi:MAG: matrixin family metalloprotease [Ignavibacteriae bacterium]|nr:T9SS C-terminal target domain-containing protein [Ignavibacteriota bacterium]NOG96860.1 matrixin family metalloprotease [Ignavibacteriota bacterium]
MHKYKPLSYTAVILLLIMITATIWGQNAPQNIYQINLKNRSFTPAKMISISKESFQGKQNLLIQFENILSIKQKSEIESLGFIINGKVSSTTVSVSTIDINNLDKLQGIRWVGTLKAEDKLSSKINSMQDDFYVITVLHRSLNKIKYESNLTAAGAEIIFNPYLPPHFLLLKVNQQAVNEISQLDEVSYIFPADDKLVNAEKVYHCPGPLTGFGFVPEFVTNGQGWDGPGLGSAALKYHFENGTPDVSGENAEVVAALETWSQYAAITWTSTSTAGQTKALDISWGANSHGDPFPFDGPSGVLAHCFYPGDLVSEPRAGDLHFDEDEFWQIGTGKDVYTIALHEAGHGLGLNHSDDINAVMYPFYGGPVSDLRQDDIDGIRSLYSTVNTSITSSPIFNPPSGTYPSPLEVRLAYGSGSNSSNTRIYYTLDGTEPTPYSFEFIPGTDYIFQRYSNTIKARAFRQNHTPSNVVTANYVLQQANPTVTNPVITPNSGTYNSTVSVSISCATDFAVIRYTTDGSEPTQASFAYGGPFNVIQSSIVKAKAFRADYSPSQTVSANYNILTQVSTPQFYPAQGGIFSEPISVTIFTETQGAQIYYTTDESEPTTSSTLYTNPFTVSSTTRIKAKAFLGQNSSTTADATFNIAITLPSPVLFPNGGSFTESVTVYIGSTVLGAVIRYTTNGAEPTSYSAIYTDPITLGVGEHTIKAKIYLDGYNPSQSTTAEFIVYTPNLVTVATPVVWPRTTQTFTVPIPLDITCATEDAVIRYTVGFGQLPADPTETGGGSITYTGPVNIGAPGSNMFLKVRAFKSGMAASEIVQTGQLSVVAPLGVVENPTFNPPPGVYNNTVQVAITSGTQFAGIIYTKDGTEPDTFLPITSPSATYSNPISTFKSTTYKTRGRRTFFSDSEIVTAEYIFACGAPTITPDSGSFIDTVTVTMSSLTDNAKIYYTLDGTEPGDSSFLYQQPILFNSGNYVLRAKAFKFGFENSITTFAEINVNAQSTLPTITTQPKNVTIEQGETAVLFVSAVGTPTPNYQWKRNGAILPGEVNDTLRFENAQLGDEGMYSVTVSNTAGSINSLVVNLTVNSLTSVEDILLSGIPTNFELLGNYPNPFNPSTKIRYAIPEQSNVKILIYNALGETVAVLSDQVKEAGYYDKNWDAGNLASGVYFLKINAASTKSNRKFNSVQKMLLIK